MEKMLSYISEYDKQSFYKISQIFTFYKYLEKHKLLK